MMARLLRPFSREALQEEAPVDLTECSGCAGFCGAEELTLEQETFTHEEQPPMLFRSWRCLIRHAIKMHELSPEPRPMVRCPICGRTASDERDGHQCGGDNAWNAHTDHQRCEGILRWRWEDR
jgi:hypothetical protein